MKSKKLSELLFKPAPLKIKDREKIYSIYEEFLQHHYFSVVQGIHDYDDNEAIFFTDLTLFLRDKYKSEDYKHTIFWTFYKLYFEELTI